MTRKPAFFWIVIVVGALLLAYYPFVLHVLLVHAGPRSSWGWSATEDGKNPPVVLTVNGTGPAVGKLFKGDRILAVNGDTRVVPELWGHFLDMWPGATYNLRVARGEVAMDVPVVLGERPRTLSLGWVKAALVGQFVVLSLGYLVAGLLIGLLRPAEASARVFAAASFLAAAGFLSGPVQIPPIPPFRLPPVEALLITLLWAPLPLLPAAIYHAYLRFPPGVPTGRGWMALKLPLYALGGLLTLWSLFDGVLDLSGRAVRIAFASSHPSVLWMGDVLARLTLPFLACVTIAAVALLVRNYRVVRDEDQRRRIQWFVWGQAVASLPLISGMTYLAVVVAAGGGVVISEEWARIFGVANMVSLLSPAVFVYSLLKHDILDIRIALRRGLQYLFATSLLRIVVFGPLVLLGIGVLTNPNRTVGEILFGQPLFLSLAVAGGLGLRYRQWLSAWIDRRFFREAYDSQHLLLGLVDEVKKLDSLAEVARLVTERVEAALHPEGVQLFWRDAASGFGVGHSSGADTVVNKVSDGSTLMRALESSGEARETTAQEIAEAGLLGAGGIAPCLAVPIGGGERRLGGFLLLGPKKSESAYTTEDRRLLSAIAAQISMVHENAALKRQTSEDARAKHDVLAHLESSGINLLKECPACGRCYDRGDETCVADRTPLKLTLPVDRTIDRKYRLDRLLGRGGMGAVYEATDLRLDRRVALKIMTGASFGNEEALRRFEREARACARLEHPNIITVFDYGQVGAEGAYLVMERLTGTTLRAEFQRTGGLDPEMAALVFDEMMHGVAAAHRAGVVHRDLKPENVFLAADGKGGRIVKVLDFGLAKLTLGDSDEGHSLTAAGTVMGTLAYMSPEQIKGARVDEGTDIFAIGVMAAEAMTGVNPFRASDPTQTVAAILGKPFHLEGEAPEVRALDAILQRCLAKERTGRFASVEEAHAALTPALRACPPLRGARGPAEADEPTRQRPLP